MKKIITFLFLISSISFGQTVLVNWNFDDGDKVADLGTDGSGNTPNNLAQTITENDGGTASFFQGNPSSGLAFATSNWEVGECYLINFNSTNYTDLSVSFDTRSSNTGPRDFKLQYSTNGTDYSDIIGSTFQSPTSFSTTPMFSFNLPTECEEEANVSIKILCNGDTQADGVGTISSTGTFRVDNVKIISALDDPLPVELTTFAASMIDNNVKLIWETATEVNNYGFEVERASASSASETSWAKLGFVEGHGNSNSPKFYSYTDNTIEASGNYQYRLKQIDIDGTFEYSDVVEVNLGTPEQFELDQNFPNPFNPTTSIRFNLPMDSNVKLNVFNTLGEEVAELLNENITAGYHSVNFDGSALNSGIYFYKLETNNFTQIRKMMLVK